MVSCEPFQSYKIPLKSNGPSVIEHNLVTIYFNLELSDNNSDTPNLIIHILDKKTSQQSCKSEGSMSYIQQNQSSLLVNSIHHHQQQNFGSTYQQQYHHYHHSSVINNEPPTTTTTITTGDQNDVSSTTTTTTVVFSALQPQLPPPPSSVPSSSTTAPTTIHVPTQQIKNEPKTELSPTQRRQQTPNSSPTCSSTNQQYLSSQHMIQTPSTTIDNQPSSQMSLSSKMISSTSPSLTNFPTKQMLTNVVDLKQPSNISSYPLATSSAASTVKAFVCTCLKPHLIHEHNCPATILIKQQSNASLAAQAVVCRPPINRSIAQRAAVASQIRTNRSISMTPTKEQGQTALLPFSISNVKTPESPTNITTIVSQPQLNQSSPKKTIIRQRSLGSLNPRQKKKSASKQANSTNEINQDQTFFYNHQNTINDSKQQFTSIIKEENISTSNPTIKLVSPLSIQTTVSNSEIDQTIDDVINGKGEIPIDDRPTISTKLPQPPSSQLVWVQNGTVTTKTWLSPLYQKQQSQQSTFDSINPNLTHQDVVNIAQQVVFPTNTESTQNNTVIQPATTITTLTANSKKRNRSKSINNATPKRNRKPALHRPHSTATASSQQEINEKPITSAPITPTLNLISKPLTWPNNMPVSSTESVRVTTNNPILNIDQNSSSFDKNGSWQTQYIENVDNMLDEFQFVSIEDQRMNSNHHFDFDINSDEFLSKTNDRFGSSTPPPPSLTNDNQRFALSSTDKLLNSSLLNTRATTGDVDVYEHFLNPCSSTSWQENQVTSSVSTPPDFQINRYQNQQQQQQHQLQQPHQQYFSSQINDEHFDSYNLQSQVRLLFDVQS